MDGAFSAVAAMSQHTILHTIETGGPGGAETILLNLASGLDAARFRSLVLLSDDRWLRKKLIERGVTTHLAASKKWYDLRLPRAMARLVRQEKVDLIHSHLPDQNFYSCIAGVLTGRPVIVTYHGLVGLSSGRSARETFKHWFIGRTAARVAVVSDYVGRLLVGCGFPKRKIVRIYNGVNFDAYGTNGSHSSLRRELGWPEAAPLVGMVANVRKAKGYEFFVQAARRVADAMPQARFLAVGAADERLSPPLLDLVRQLQLEDRFRFLGFREDVPAVLRALDVFVLSSTSEGFSLATVEAMAAGKPVVVTRSGGTQELVDDGRTGYLVPPSDPAALADKICETLRDPARAAALGQAGREKAFREFAIASMVRGYEQLYEELLDAR
jgi:glycosyltransferase involved in cell wall biosynthesis